MYVCTCTSVGQQREETKPNTGTRLQPQMLPIEFGHKEISKLGIRIFMEALQHTMQKHVIHVSLVHIHWKKCVMEYPLTSIDL